MEDYEKLKSQIRVIPLGREKELDDLLKDQELMATLDRMCRKSEANLAIYIQFLMENAGEHSLPDFVRMIVARARKTRPEMC